MFALQWTQDEAIAYECARECLTDLLSIAVGALDEAQSQSRPDLSGIEALERDLQRLGQERQSLSLPDHQNIAQVRHEYGAWIAAQRGLRPWRTSARALIGQRYPALARLAEQAGP